MTDPFNTLRLDDERIEPDAGFATRLRARLVTALASDTPDFPVIDLPARRSTTMTDTTETTAASSPDSSPPTARITPYLCVHDGAAALRWYADVFEATETVRFVGDDGRIGHAEVSIGGAALMLSDEYPEIHVTSPRTLGGTAGTLHLNVPDVDAVYARAVAAGAITHSEPADQAYGERSCTIVDPFGHRWMVQTTIAHPTLDEVNAAMEGYTAIAPPTDED